MEIKTGMTAFLCITVMIISTLSVTGILFRESEDYHIIMVDFRDARDISYIRYTGAKILETYPSRVLVEVSGKGLESIRSTGLFVNTLPNRTRVWVKSHTFDVQEGMPEFCEELTIGGYGPGTEGLYILHTIGPIHPRWIAMLEQVGVELINYVPNYAYEVLMTPETAERVEGLYFVDWVGIYQPAFKLHPRLDVGTVTVRLSPGFHEDNLVKINTNFDVIGYENLREDGHRLILEVDIVEHLEELARINDVYHISPYTEPKLTAEMDAQLLGGGLWFMDDEYDHSGGSQREGDPDIPYRKHGDFGAYINQIGYTGKGVTVAVADTGIGDGTVGDAGHEDFTGRVIGGYSAGENEENWADGHYHGTACAGLVGGNTHAGTGSTFNFAEYYHGQSLAYESELFAMKIFSDDAEFMPDELYPIVEIPAQLSDAYVHSNSWGGPGNSEYDERDEIFDQAVRDADRDTSENRPMVITAAVGNDGGSIRGGSLGYNTNDNQISGDQTINSPANGKNVISVGGNRPYKPFLDYIPEDMYDYSSRGWTVDNRVKPDVIAPSQSVTTQNTPLDGGGYTSASGTSFGNPLVAGAASIVVDWYEQNHGVRPSPAMVKAILINTANELDPGVGNTRGHIPNRDEGWGVPDISKLEYPLEDPISLMFEDQDNLLQTGDSVEYHVTYDEPDEPLKFTLTWTDKNAMSGDGLGGAPTLKNNLDLEVETPGGEIIYGNAFDRSGDGNSDDGFTYPDAEVMADFDHNGDGRDNVNNVLNVYIHPDILEEGFYTVKITGTNIPSDANNDGSPNQDYALVVYNAIGEDPGDPPEVTLTRPQGGETFTAGETEDVLWTTSAGEDPVDHVSLFYSPDGGSMWNTIETEIGDTGSYTWTVPNEHSSDCLFRVQVRDTSGRTAEDVSGTFSIEGVPPAPPSGLNVELYGTAQAISNSMFEDDHEPWELTRVVDEGEAHWDPENHIDGGSIYVSVEAEGEDVRLTEDSYWEQSISPTSDDLVISSAFRKNILYDDGMGWETQVHSALVELMVHDTDVGWYTVLMDDDVTSGDTGWIESGDVSYTPLGTVDAVRVRMEVEGEGDTGPMGNDHAALAEIWVDHVSVVAGTPASTEDNLLTWDASPDDPAGAIHYNIYRSANDGGPWDTPMETVDGDGSSAYSFVDTGAGTGDDVLWWYVVRTVSFHGMEEDNTDAVREPALDLVTFDIQLYADPDSEGWNFVSFNLIPTDASLESILEDAEHGISGNYDRVIHYDASVGRWYSYVPDRPGHFNNLNSWDHRMGIWIRMTGDDVLTVEGTEPTSTTLILEPGWNMMGLPSKNSGNHALPAEISSVGYFDASADHNIVYTDATGFDFEPGKGYWLYNPADSVVHWELIYGV